MSSETIPRSPVENWEQIRNAWVQAVDDVLSEVEAWCEAEGWPTHRESKWIDEDRLGQYTIPVLLIDTPGGRLHLDPLARFIVGADGRIDVYSFPQYHTAILLSSKNAWRFCTVDGPKLDKPFDKPSFLRIAKRLTMQT